MLVEINLLGDKERDRPAFVVAAISLILLGLIVGLVFYFLGNSLENKQQEVVAQSAEVVAQQAAIQAQMQSSATLNDTQKLQKTVEWAESYQYDTLPLIRELTSLLPERGFFLNFSFTSPSSTTVDVQFDTSREAAFYLTQLKSSEMVTAVTLSSLTYQPFDETSESTTADAEQEISVMPRYLASYAITFLDTRMPAEGTAVPVDPNAPPVEGETPAEETSPTEESPAETTEEQTETTTPATEQPVPADDAEGAETSE